LREHSELLDFSLLGQWEIHRGKKPCAIPGDGELIRRNLTLVFILLSGPSPVQGRNAAFVPASRIFRLAGPSLGFLYRFLLRVSQEG